MSRLFGDTEVREKDEGQMVRLPHSLWERLTRIADLETEKAKQSKPTAKSISRNAVIRKVLEEFVEKYEADEAKKSGKRATGQ